MLLYLAILRQICFSWLKKSKLYESFFRQKKSNSINCKTLNDFIKKKILAITKVFHFINIIIQIFVNIKIYYFSLILLFFIPLFPCCA